MTFWIVFFFFQSQRIICLTMATNATPGTLMDREVVAACLLRSHLPQMNCVCAYVREGFERVADVCVRVCVGWRVDVHVQEDASLTLP